MNIKDFEHYENFYDFSKENKNFLKKLEEKYEDVKDENIKKQIDTVKAYVENKIRENTEPQTQEIIEEGGGQEDMIEEDEDDNSDDWVDVEEDITEKGEKGSESWIGNENSHIIPGQQTKKISKYFAEMRKNDRTQTGELKLLSGKIAGNKEYLMLYNQNLRFEDDEKKRIRQICQDRQMQRRLLCLQNAMVLKGMNDQRVNQIMLKNYRYYLNKMKIKKDKVNKKRYMNNKKIWMR